MKVHSEIETESDKINLDVRRLVVSYLKNGLQRYDKLLFESMYGAGVTFNVPDSFSSLIILE